MGRVSFHSEKRSLASGRHRVFSFLSNLDHMENLMPEQVVNWNSNGRQCSFDIKGMAHIELMLGEMVQDKLVTVDSGPDNPIDLQLLFELSEAGQEQCDCVITLHAELSMMLQMMASTPLQNLVNIMGDKLQEQFS